MFHCHEHQQPRFHNCYWCPFLQRLHRFQTLSWTPPSGYNLFAGRLFLFGLLAHFYNRCEHYTPVLYPEMKKEECHLFKILLKSTNVYIGLRSVLLFEMMYKNIWQISQPGFVRAFRFSVNLPVSKIRLIKISISRYPYGL